MVFPSAFSMVSVSNMIPTHKDTKEFWVTDFFFFFIFEFEITLFSRGKNQGVTIPQAPQITTERVFSLTFWIIPNCWLVEVIVR